MCDIVDVPTEVSERSEKMEREGVPLKEEGVIWSLPEAGVALNVEGVMCSPPGAAGGKDDGEMVDKVEGVRGPDERAGEGGLLGCSKRLNFCCSTCLVFRYFACNTPGDTSSTVV